MLFGETAMRFGKPAISSPIAPMDIRERRMRFPVAANGFGKAPKAMAVTAMGSRWTASR